MLPENVLDNFIEMTLCWMCVLHANVVDEKVCENNYIAQIAFMFPYSNLVGRGCVIQNENSNMD